MKANITKTINFGGGIAGSTIIAFVKGETIDPAVVEQYQPQLVAAGVIDGVAAASEATPTAEADQSTKRARKEKK